MKQLLEESNDKRNLQKKFIEEFQNKKCDKILRQIKIRNERDQRKQFIKESFTKTINKSQKSIDQSPNMTNRNDHSYTPEQDRSRTERSPNSSSPVQNSPNSYEQNFLSSQGLSNMQSPNQSPITKSISVISLNRQSDFLLEDQSDTTSNQITPRVILTQRALNPKEVMKSCVGQKAIDKVILKAFHTPGVDWTNPCYRSLESQKYSQNQLNKKIQNMMYKQQEQSNSKQSFSLMWDNYKNQDEIQSASFQVDDTTKNIQNQSTQMFNRQESTEAILKGSPVSNKSQAYNHNLNNSLIYQRDNVFARTHLQNSFQRQDRQKAKSEQLNFNNQHQIHSNDFIIEKEQSQQKLFRIVNRNVLPSVNKNNSSIIKNDSFSASPLNPLKTQNSFTSTIRKESSPNQTQQQFCRNKLSSTSSFNYNNNNTSNMNNTQLNQSKFNNFYKSESTGRINGKRPDINEIHSNNSINILNDTMGQFKTSKQIKQEVQTQLQIKQTILKQFMNEKNYSNSTRNGQLNMLQNNPVEAKSLQKAVVAKLLKATNNSNTPRRTNFNTIHIDIIQKLNIDKQKYIQSQL